MKTEKQIIRYECKVNGVFGRNRKVKLAHFTILDAPAECPVAVETLLPVFRAKLAEIAFKGGVAKVTGTPITVTTYYEGAVPVSTSEAFYLFSGEVLHREQIEGAGVTFRAAGGAA